jgi:Putative zinc-finger
VGEAVAAPGERRRSGGGRCLRARSLVRSRAAGEGLGDLDRRRLDAHLSGCERCREFAAANSPTVEGGKDPSPVANVSSVEAAGTTSDQGRSDVDAMGQDKKRSVVGQGYGPSKGRQFLYYGLFILAIVAIYIGGKIAVSELDKAPKNDPAAAPGSQEAAPQTPPKKFQ